MKKIPDIINRLWNVCGQMEVGALLTCGSGIKTIIPDPQVNNARLPFGYTQGTSGQYSVIFQKKAEIISLTKILVSFCFLMRIS